MSAPAPQDELLRQAEAALARGVLWEPEGLNPDPPRLDPDEPRRSAAELRLLAHALGVVEARPAPPPHLIDPPRAGYRSATLEGTPVAWPALAGALALQDPAALHESTADLWRVDAQLAHACTSPPTDTPAWRALARRWLLSPGRRLVQDLRLLDVLADPEASDPDGATTLGWEALMSAAGRGLPPTPARAWAEHAAVHAAWPVASPDAWQPLDAVHALYTLEQGSPAHARAGALCWLLRQAETVQVVQIGKLRRRLADELPSRLAVAFSPDSAPGRAAAAAAEVEALCLAHAARITRARRPEADPADTWRLARWIQTTTLASPFYGGDPEALAARLRALLPPEAPPTPTHPGPADPAHFSGPLGGGVDLTEHAWAVAAATHYAHHESGLRPVPQPLVEQLVNLARRPLRRDEVQLELALAQAGHEDLLAPPLLAGRTLADGVRADWLGLLGAPAVEPLLEVLDQAPTRLRWLATAALDDGERVQDALARPLLERWRAGSLGAWTADERCALAVGLQRLWDPGDTERWMAALPGTSEEDRPVLLRVLLQRRGEADPALQRQAVELLIEMAAQEPLPSPVRVGALGVALPWLQRLRGAPAELLRARALALGGQRPFRDSVTLRRELGRLGLEATG